MNVDFTGLLNVLYTLGSSWELLRKGGLRERLEERTHWGSSGAQSGRCWEYFGMKVRLHSGKLQHVFQHNPLYLSVFTQSRALCYLEDSAPISADSDPGMPGASPAINHRRRATNTTSTQMFHFSPQRQCIFPRDERTCQLHSNISTNLLRGTLFLAKVHLLATFLHSSTHLHSPASVGFPRNKTPSSTMSHIPLLSSSIHQLEIEKEELR